MPRRYRSIKSAIYEVQWRRVLQSRYIVIGGLVVVIIVLAGAYYVWVNRPLLDADITDRAKFTVYVPTTSPNGYDLEKDLTVVSDDTLTYSFANRYDNATITVTVQPRPSHFDMKQMAEGGSVNSTATQNGTLYNLSAEGTSKYLLDMGDSLVFITSAKNINTATINALAASLKKVN